MRQRTEFTSFRSIGHAPQVRKPGEPLLSRYGGRLLDRGSPILFAAFRPTHDVAQRGERREFDGAVGRRYADGTASPGRAD